VPWTLSITTLSLWIVGVLVPYTLHGYIHLFLVVVIAAVMIPASYNKLFRGD